MLKRGYTLIEIAIVIVIMMFILGIILSAFITVGPNKALDGDTQTVKATLEEARELTLSAKGDTQYGVHLETNHVMLFKGAVYSPSDPTNEVVGLNNKVNISAITLQGGGSEVIFDRLTGATQEPGTTTLSLIASPTTKHDIIISPTGTVDTQ